MNLWSRNIAAEQAAAIEALRARKRLAKIRAAREAKAAQKDKD